MRKVHAREIWELIQCSARHWRDDDAPTIGAALAFYCAFSLAPLIIILITIAGLVVGEEIAYGHLTAQLTALFGPGTTKILIEAVKSSRDTEGLLATGLSILTLFIGATTVFAALEAALEQIWGAKALVPKGIRGFMRSRILSFGVILAIGFLLLVSLTISTGLSHLREVIVARFTGLVVLTGALDFAISLSLSAGLFALIYRYMPAKRLPWRPVLIGSIITALLFYAGRWAISLYLAGATQPSAFGAAASFAALLLWLYYSAQIFLFGAEFTACLGKLRIAMPEKK